MSEREEMSTPMKTESPTTVASQLPFDTSLLEPPKMEEPKSRINFLRRKVKSKDENNEEIDEGEIERLQKKVELLKKKRQLMLKIKKMERSLDTGDVDTDDDATFNKQHGSPKRWPSLKPRYWRRRDDSDDELTYDDEDSPILNKIHSALDCIEASCDPVINEIVDLDVMCINRTGKESDESLYTQGVEDIVLPQIKEKEVTTEVDNADEDQKEADNINDRKRVAVLAAPIMMLAKTMSQKFAEADEAAIVPTAEKTNLSNEQSANQDSVYDAYGNKGGWVEKVQISHSSVQNDDDNDVGIDCFGALSSEAKTETANEQSSEVDAKFNRVTLAALALSGLSITAKKITKKKDEDVPPVRVVLSVLKNEESSPFVHLSSLRVVEDPSRATNRKKSTKYHVMGVWDIANNHGAAGTEQTKSTVSFSKLAGLSAVEERAAEVKSDRNADVKMSPSMIHLRVSIKRDDSTELLPIGVAKVLVCGGPRNVELAVPLRAEYYKSMEELVKKLRTKQPQTKWDAFKTFVFEDEEDALKCARFKGHKETYRLEKDSFIRINLKVAPEFQDVPEQLSCFPTNKTIESDSESKSAADDTTAVVINNATVSSESKVIEADTSKPVDDEPKEQNATRETKKSWSNNTKKGPVPVEDHGKLVAANVVGSVAVRPASKEELSNGRTSSLQEASQEPKNDSAPVNDNNSTEEEEDAADLTKADTSRPVEDASAATVTSSKSKRSWFKKSKSKPTKDTYLAAAVVVGTGAAVHAVSSSTETEDISEQTAICSEAADRGTENENGTSSCGEAVSGVEAPIFEDNLSASFAVEKPEHSSAPMKIAWFRRVQTTSKIEGFNPTCGTNKSPYQSTKTCDTETSQSSSAEDTQPEDKDLAISNVNNVPTKVEDKSIGGTGSVENENADTNGSSKEFAEKTKRRLKSNRSKNNMSESTGINEDEDNGFAIEVGATAVAATVVGVGLSNENISGIVASIEVSKAEGETNPVMEEDDNVEAPCFCNVNEMMETDMPTDITEGANCIKDDVSVASDELGKTIDLFGDSYVMDISVVEPEGDDDYHLSECNCEDCMGRSDRNEECEGIELELKSKALKSKDCDQRTASESKKSIRNVYCLVGKLARSKSRKRQ